MGKYYVSEDWQDGLVTVVSGEEPYPNCTSVTLDDVVVRRYKKAAREKTLAYRELLEAVRAAEKVVERSSEDFNNYSRREKTRFLESNGWKKVDTSVFRKNGKTLKMHEAFDAAVKDYKNSLMA